jgi:hypothetical protein
LESDSEDDDANIPDLAEDPSIYTPPTWWEGDTETDSEPDADMPGLGPDSESDDADAIPPLLSVTDYEIALLSSMRHLWR